LKNQGPISSTSVWKCKTPKARNAHWLKNGEESGGSK